MWLLWIQNKFPEGSTYRCRTNCNLCKTAILYWPLTRIFVNFTADYFKLKSYSSSFESRLLQTQHGYFKWFMMLHDPGVWTFTRLWFPPASVLSCVCCPLNPLISISPLRRLLRWPCLSHKPRIIPTDPPPPAHNRGGCIPQRSLSLQRGDRLILLLLYRFFFL